MRNTLPPLRSNELLCGGPNIGHLDKDLGPVMARVSVKKSARDNCTLAHQTPNGFPVRVLRNDQLHFANVSFRNVYTHRIIARCAGGRNERKYYRGFFAIAPFDGFVVRPTGKDL
jgi:hypothetical protein